MDFLSAESKERIVTLERELRDQDQALQDKKTELQEKERELEAKVGAL